MGSLLIHTMLWSSVAAAATNQATPARTQASLQVQVYAVKGDLDASLAKSTCKAIEDNFSLPCRYKLVPQPERWTTRDNRIDAAAFLDAQFSHSARQAASPVRVSHKSGQIDLWLTSKDVYEGSRPYVFGIMSMTDRIGIVSLYRMLDLARPALTTKRFHKVVIHELAHALDLGHHDLDSCVMQVEPDLAHLDKGSSRLCRTCRKHAIRTINRLQRKGQFLWDRIAGHRVRGQLHQARGLLLPLLRESKVHPELQNQAQRLWSSLLTK